MISAALSAVAVAAAYLIGAVPFGFLMVRWLKGIDVRTVGSGNIGATNAARALGFRYFWLILALDLAKGLLPTLGFPRAFEAVSGHPAPPDLAVLVAMATIIGHNWPVYLRFRGGKGVATSIGAMLALDWIAMLAAVGGFVGSFGVWRYVSLSSLAGAVVFAVVHFARVDHPWSREEFAMSLGTIAVVVLLFVRHRKNLGRIAAGTEPRVPLRGRGKAGGPGGRLAVGWLVVLVVVVGLVVAGSARLKALVRPEVLAIGQSTITQVDQAATGHQRVERLAFADGGRALVVTCPRYDRLLFYRVGRDDRLELAHDLELAGRPVAVCPLRDRVYVLERPPGDERHVQPGWLEAFDLDGQPAGPRRAVGFYPDDLAITPDGRRALVLCSGRAEGSDDRGAPALEVHDLSAPADAGPIGSLAFDGPRDDPARLSLSTTGAAAAVTLHGSNSVAAVDLSDPDHPRMLTRSSLPALDHPYPSRTQDDWILMPVASGSEAVGFSLAGFGSCVASTLPHDSGLEFSQYSSRSDPTRLGRLRLRSGRLGLSAVRPTAVAHSPERGLFAVANRAGSVHLIAVRSGGVALADRHGR